MQAPGTATHVRTLEFHASSTLVSSYMIDVCRISQAVLLRSKRANGCWPCPQEEAGGHEDMPFRIVLKSNEHASHLHVRGRIGRIDSEVRCPALCSNLLCMYVHTDEFACHHACVGRRSRSTSSSTATTMRRTCTSAGTSMRRCLWQPHV